MPLRSWNALTRLSDPFYLTTLHLLPEELFLSDKDTQPAILCMAKKM